MRVILESQIEGSFYGFEGESVFKFTNGQIWEQAEYKYLYHYAYRPSAQIVEDGGHHYLLVDGVRDRVLVKKVR